MTTNVSVRIDRVATGGKGIGNLNDGRVIFVEGAIPGDLVEARITTSKKRFAEGVTTAVVEASLDRRTPPCPHAATCGGCDWQHVEPDAASDMRRAVVADTLRRQGRLDPAEHGFEIRSGPALPAEGYRTSLRAVVSGGRGGFRARGSHNAVLLDVCLTAHPLAAELLIDGRFGSAKEASISVGARTGERLVVLEGVDDLDGELAGGKISLPDDVAVVSRRQLEAGAKVAIHEEIHGHRFQISADSFFQIRPDGAEALVTAVRAAIGDQPGPMVDAYAGVGLFGALVAAGRSLISIEASPSSTIDAKVNLPADAEILQIPVERWKPQPASVVIADPSRSGLGKDGVATLTATGASTFVLVSCDPASLGRDAGLLTAAGYQLTDVTVFDLFGNTSHIEAVSVFRKPV